MSFDWVDFSVLTSVIAVLSITAGLVLLYRRIYAKWLKRHLSGLFLHSAIQGAIAVIGVLAAIAAVPQLQGFARTLLAGSGIAALALSLSAQESLGNVISGLFISIFRPFDVGDRIRLLGTGTVGYVESITLRHTIIRTIENARVIVPNSKLNAEMIENSDAVDTLASYAIDVSVAYESDVRRAAEILADAIGSHPSFVDTRTDGSAPLVNVQLRAFESSGVSLRAWMWTKTVAENFQACSDVRFELLDRFREAGIEIPYDKIEIAGSGPDHDIGI